MFFFVTIILQRLNIDRRSIKLFLELYKKNDWFYHLLHLCVRKVGKLKTKKISEDVL